MRPKMHPLTPRLTSENLDRLCAFCCPLFALLAATRALLATDDSPHVLYLRSTKSFTIAKIASEGNETLTVLLPYNKGLLMKMVHERSQVIRERYVEEGLLLTARVSQRMADTLAPYLIQDEVEEEGFESPLLP